MIYQTNSLFRLVNDALNLMLFVFFSTICSYNFHWYLSRHSNTEVTRVAWTAKHKYLHLTLYIIGLLGAVYFAWKLIDHLFWLSGAVILTFLYSAPKLPLKPFTYLRKIAVGKTIFLTFVWMYVTSFLPIVISTSPFTWQHLLFCSYRFFLIYSICIIFDYRDRENDRKEGIRSMITYFNEKGINALFYISLLLHAVFAISLYWFGFSFLLVFLLIVPGIIVLLLYNNAKRNFSDYLYYFILDGLMMLSALLTSFLSF